MTPKKIIYPLVLFVCFLGIFGLGAWVGVNKLTYYVPQPDNVDFSLFWDAYKTIQEKYIDPSKITEQEIVYGAIRGMTKSIGDPYTDFFNPTQAKKFHEDLAGSFSGIGAEIGIRKDVLTIISPLKDSPAERAGLKPGDVILEINGTETNNMPTEEAVSLIRGERGTKVTLSIFREDWNSTKDIEIIRDTIKIPLMDWSLKDDKIAYIQIYQFDERLVYDFEKAVMQILQSPADRIILDLRNNPGGYLTVGQHIAGYFLENGQTVTIEDFGQHQEKQIYKAEGSASLAGYPVVVLINEGTASASEIVAGALRDNRNVKLIGQKSYGKGSVQELISLPGGSSLKVTIAKWLTPNGASISEVGLTPDIKVDIIESEADEEDPKDQQLDKALEIIKGLQ